MLKWMTVIFLGGVSSFWFTLTVLTNGQCLSFCDDLGWCRCVVGGTGQGNPAGAPSLFLPKHPQNRKQSRSETIGVQRQKHTLYQNRQRLVACGNKSVNERRHGQRSRGRERQGKNRYCEICSVATCFDTYSEKKDLSNVH